MFCEVCQLVPATQCCGRSLSSVWAQQWEPAAAPASRVAPQHIVDTTSPPSSSSAAVGSDGRGSVRPTPRSTPTHRQMPTNAEQLLAFKAHEYLDSRCAGGLLALAALGCAVCRH